MVVKYRYGNAPATLGVAVVPSRPRGRIGSPGANSSHPVRRGDSAVVGAGSGRRAEGDSRIYRLG